MIVRELDKGASYEELLFYIGHQFSADFWCKPAEKFLRWHRNLFYSSAMGNAGFSMLYWGFFDREKSWREIAGLADPKESLRRTKGFRRFWDCRATQILDTLRNDLYKERVWERTGTGEMYVDLTMAEEAAGYRQTTPGTK